MDREAFGRLVREALAHLYDPDALADHPLGKLLLPAEERSPTEALQRILAEAIHQLRPSRGAPQYEHRLRRYQQMTFRYLEGLEPAAIAVRLNVGERQGRRDHQEALEALASILWARYSRLRWSVQPEEQPQASEDPRSDSLDSELRRIASAPVREPVSLREIMTGVASTVERLALDRDALVSLNVPDPLPSISMDRVVLRQVLLSLLSYAIEHAGSRAVDLSAWASLDRVQVRITLELVAGPRQKPAATSVLASARLVELQGGGFEHRGAGGPVEELLLSLPCVEFCTVLVIDDNPDFVRLFQRYLADSPYRIVQAGIAGDAIEIARAAQPDVITLDVMMPTQDGWETLQALKSDDETRHIPVIICSVLQEPALALSLGAAGFLAKPINRQSLIAALERYVPQPAAPAPQA